MKYPSFTLTPEEIKLADPEAFADRLAEFLQSHVCPDPSDRDLLLIFLDRLFLAFCDDFSDEQLRTGTRVELEPLSDAHIASLRALQRRANQKQTSDEIKPRAQAVAAD